MKVKLLRNPSACLGCELNEGETGNVNEKLGAQLIGLGLAVGIETKPEVKAVAEKPAIADAQTPSVKSTSKNQNPKLKDK